MTEGSRLERALKAPAAPAGDPAFVLAVIERAEQERFRAASVLTLLRGAGLAAAAAALAVPFAEWGAAHSQAPSDGTFGRRGPDAPGGRDSVHDRTDIRGLGAVIALHPFPQVSAS